MLGRIKGPVRFREPLSFYTSLRIGGPAEFLIAPQDLDDLRNALSFAEQESLPLVVLGAGTNLLVADEGLPAVVLKLDGAFARVAFEGTEVVAGAGLPLPALIREAAVKGLGGLEGFAGLPATVGGALATRAVGGDRVLADFCSAIYFVRRDGTLGEFRPALHLAPAVFLEQLVVEGAILLGARLRLVHRPVAEVQKDLRRAMKARRAAEPWALASVGYVWKDPPREEAARLVRQAGLAGKRVNGAEIPMKNGNFIVNRDRARAADVLALMELAREQVERRLGIRLERRLQLLGLDARTAAPARALALAG